MRVRVTGTEAYLGCLVASMLFEDGHDIVVHGDERLLWKER